VGGTSRDAEGGRDVIVHTQRLRRPKAVVALIDHEFVPDPWGRDFCDARVDEDGQVRPCARRRAEHGGAQLREGSR
jgi:hypothetical protein